MKKLLILLILLFVLPAYAQQCSEENPCPQVARLMVVGGSTPVGAADGPNEYYYSAGATTTSDTGPINYFQGAPITITTGGTITKVGVRVINTLLTAQYIKITLWKNTGSFVLHECAPTITVPAEFEAGWIDATLASPLAVSSSDIVRLMMVGDLADVSIGVYLVQNAGGYYQDRAYADGCSSTAPSWTADYTVALRVYVD